MNTITPLSVMIIFFNPSQETTDIKLLINYQIPDTITYITGSVNRNKINIICVCPILFL